MGHRTSVYLPDDVAAAWQASGKSIAQLMRAGLASQRYMQVTERNAEIVERLERLELLLTMLGESVDSLTRRVEDSPRRPLRGADLLPKLEAHLDTDPPGSPLFSKEVFERLMPRRGDAADRQG